MGVIIRRFLCMNLPTAGLVIGIIGAFLGILQMLLITSTIARFDEQFEKYYKKPLHDDSDLEDLTDTGIKTFVYGYMWLMLLMCLLDLLSSILLTHGANKKSHKMLLLWLILKGITLILLIPPAFIGIIVGIVFICIGLGGVLLVASILLMIFVAIFAYIYLAIYSLYFYIRDELQTPVQFDFEAQHYLNKPSGRH